MPTIVQVQDGDTLCTIAIAHGFLNCDALRGDPANAGLLGRDLVLGEFVTIPDRRPNVAGRGSDARHPFTRAGVPIPGLRLVHGSANLPYRQDPALAFLNVSNYVSNLAGANGQQAFPAAFGFDQHAHEDVDAFKIEVTDPSATAASVNVELRAMRPVYRADGTVERHEVFNDANAALRVLTVACQRIRGMKSLRSRYLRLVTDEADLAQLSGNPPRADGTAQGLFVSDEADGNAGAADRTEILDQLVQATYVIQGCRAPAGQQCTLRRSLPVGQNRQRIKVCFHLFRATVGGANVGGLTPQHLRRRTFKWYRRTYAPVELSPKLVAPNIEILDPPSADMLVISNDHGNSATGVNAGGAASTLSFRLGRPPAGILAAIGSIMDPTVTINPVAGNTPAQVAAAIIAALPAGFNGVAFTNPPAFNAVDGSVDIKISRTDGTRVAIRSEQTTDTGLTVAVARLNMNSINQAHPGNSLMAASIDFRAVIRAAPGADDRMDCYVIGQFTGPSLRGRAFPPSIDLPPAFQPPSPLRWAAVMAASSNSGAVMDGSDNLPFTYPHESGHVLFDAFHTDGADPGGPTELMSGTGTSVANGVNATKRICDGPVTVRYAFFTPQPAPPNPPPAVGDASVAAINAAQRLLARGAGVFEGW